MYDSFDNTYQVSADATDECDREGTFHLGHDWNRFPLEDDVPRGSNGSFATVGHGWTGAISVRERDERASWTKCTRRVRVLAEV